METLFTTSYEMYGTQHIMVTLSRNLPFYYAERTTEIPSHPHNNREEKHTFAMDKGVFYWPGNGRVIPADFIKEWFLFEIPGYDKAETDRIRSEQIGRELAEYRQRMENQVPTDEELYEMRAAFGPGTTVVNVITGKKTQL